MKGRGRADERYEHSVFINCPFDPDYHELLRACAFGVLACGFIPRCALETADAGELRLPKILRMIAECKYGIHDISRMPPAGELPRFNMPFECGLFWGCARFGPGKHRRKGILVMDAKPYQYQRAMSDIAGMDIHVHGNDPRLLLVEVRVWLGSQVSKALRLRMPGHDWIFERYRQFGEELPAYLAKLGEKGRLRLTVDDLAKPSSFFEFSKVAAWWLKERPEYRRHA